MSPVGPATALDEKRLFRIAWSGLPCPGKASVGQGREMLLHQGEELRPRAVVSKELQGALWAGWPARSSPTVRQLRCSLEHAEAPWAGQLRAVRQCPVEVTGVARFGLEFDETEVLARTWRIRVHR